MIEYLGRDGAMTKWRIDGSDFSARYDKCHSYEKFRRVIQCYPRDFDRRNLPHQPFLLE